MLTLLAIAMLFGAVGLAAWLDREHDLSDAGALNARRADRLAQELRETLAMARVAIEGFETDLRGLPAGAARPASLIHAAQARAGLLARLPMPFELHALDAEGKVIELAPPAAAGDSPPAPPTRVRAHAHAKPAPVSRGWHVGTAQGPAGARVVPLIWTAAPNPHGIAAFAVDLLHEPLLRRFERSRVPQGGGVVVFRVEADGGLTVLARAPHDEAELGRTVRGPLAQALAGSPRGSFHSRGHLDDTVRLVAYRRLEGDATGLVVAYGVATDALLAPWRARLLWMVAITLVLAAALGAGAWRLERALRMQARQRQALARSEREYRTLADHLPDVVVRLDREGRHLYANAATEQATGLPPGAFIGKTNADLGMPAENVSAWMAALHRAFERGASERIEFSFHGPQGLRQWESVVMPEPAPEGAPATALVISRDITERRQAETARDALNRRLADVLESMSDGFVSLGRDWRYVAVNAKAGELLGREPAGLIGRHIWTEFPEGVGQPFHRAYERAMNEGVMVVLEEHYAPWDRWFENRIYPSADGIAIFFTDVTERRVAADALRASESSHRQMFEANPHPMWVYDLETLAFLAVNDAAVGRYGYTRDEFLRMTIKEIRPPEDVPRLLANVGAVQGGIDDAGLWRHRTKDGRLLEVEITSHTLRYAGHDAELVLAHDVTGRVEAERARRESEERLRLALQAANQGLYDLDLRSGEAVVSPEYARMLGWEPEAFHETHAAWRERLHPDDRAAVEQAFEDYVAGRRADYRVEFRQRKRDGGWKWILSVGRIQRRDAEGRPLRMLGTHTDLDMIKAAQGAELAATRRFEKLFDAAPEAISVSEMTSGRLLQVNDAFCELFGHAREQLIGPASLELDLWTEPQGREHVVERLRAGAAVHGFEAVARSASGGLIDVLISAERIDFDGREALLLMFRDISERKRLEAALGASQARLEHLLARAPTAVYTARASGNYAATYFSPNLGSLLGWQPQDFLADSGFWLSHVHPDDRDALLQQLDALATRDELAMEYRFQHADGRWRWMRDQVSVQRDERGDAVELVGAWIDITERREAEEQVRRLAAELEQRVQERTAQLALSEARFRTIFESVPVAISEEDWSGVQRLLRELRAGGVSDGPAYFAAHPEFVARCLRAVRIVRLNQKALSLHDAEDQKRDLPDLQAFYPDPQDQAQFVGELEALWAGRRIYTAKRHLPSVAGRPLKLMMTISLPALDSQDPMALVCLVDITEIDRLNQELDQSLAQLRQVNKELETFTYSVSHDLKAPLRGIDGYSRLLLADHAQALDEEGRRFLGHIRQATQHMGVLIDDLLAYSRLERRALTLTALPIAPVVEGVLAPFRSDLQARGVELSVDVDSGLRATADAQGLAMALRNLVDNALKFTRDSRPARLHVSAARLEGRLRLSLRDNGTGFDMKFHDRIFAIFQRLHRAEEFPGTGVGLAIVRKAMERMGGRVWAESEPGQGATFHLELPAAA